MAQQSSTQVDSGDGPSGPGTLKRGLRQRHLTMIAIGGVIGAGLFVGSGVVINETGPAAFLSYAITGVLIILVMRMLGEMATANPSTGSFADYSRMALGRWAGFSVAWLYWYFWVIVVGFEAVAGAKILTFWFDAPLWILSLVLMVLMTGTNLFSVGSYGEFEYWFAGIKVAAIIVFLVLGTAYVLGLWPGQGTDFSNLTDQGGFLPNGVGAIFSSIVVVVFSMVGAEIATIAAAESHDPEKAIAKATQSVILRVALFFVGSIFLLACIVPWNDTELGASPYVAAFSEMGIPYADQIMNAVVLTAVLSCLNSGLYTASRMLFVLAARREAPMRLITVNRRGVPVWAILFSTVVGFLSVIAAYVSPDTVFLFLLNSSGAVILFVYLLIALSQLVLRRRTPDERLTVKMWAYPVLTLVAVAGILAVLGQMAWNSDTRSQLLLSLLSWGVVLVLYGVTRWRGGSVAVEELVAGEPARRVLVLANRTLTASELHDALHRIEGSDAAEYHVVVPANPIDTGQAHREGAAFVWEATAQAAQERLDSTLETLRADGLTVDGALGDYRPLVALERAVAEFRPDHVVISTQPDDTSTRVHHGLVDEARRRLEVPVQHVVVPA
ncbi:amino acid permease [Nocardioides mesophilus]|uniref:Amino acid permease n=1 Tax=Nocardioides mesophilus TaxID=433659 RepID=A0A7G9RFU2_9ACTN|nr:amino acid permease [Nocardioides mesophilus]QNN54467.1 amino acid permease [Nocardioides mesophilus]